MPPRPLLSNADRDAYRAALRRRAAVPAPTPATVTNKKSQPGRKPPPPERPSQHQLDTSSSSCKRRSPAKTCGEPALLDRAYELKARWPFDRLLLVMELTNGTCDLYSLPRRSQPSFCCMMTGDFYEPERLVREAIASVLVGCGRREALGEQPCRVVDLGANNGWFSAYMLQLGAHVVSVEPQSDLAAAVRATARLNCWEDRSRVINARACVKNDRRCYVPKDSQGCSVGGGWRFGGGMSQIRAVHADRCAVMHGLPRTVGGVGLTDVLLRGGKQSAVGRRLSGATAVIDRLPLRRLASESRSAWDYLLLPWTSLFQTSTSSSPHPATHKPRAKPRDTSPHERPGHRLPGHVTNKPVAKAWTPPPRVDPSRTLAPYRAASNGAAPRAVHGAVLDLLKLDVDGPEGAMLEEIDGLITSQQLQIRSILVEASFVRPSQLRRFQRVHGYTCYRLAAHDRRRQMTREGWDAFSPPGTIARLDRLAEQHLYGDRKVSRYSPHNVRTIFKPSSNHMHADDMKYTPAGDNISRLELEKELFGVRAMRHVFRAKSNLSLQGWVTLSNPIHSVGYESAPFSWLLTLDGDLAEPVIPEVDWRMASAEYREAKKRGWLSPTSESEEAYVLLGINRSAI